jgi:RNA polymerase sigma-B factor
VRYHRTGDLDAREELVVRFMPLARQLAARYRHAGEPLEDLVQVACVGLIKAVDRYDPERGNGFTRYAVPTMLGEIKRHFRDKGWSVHVPRATQELVLKVGEALGDLPSRLGRSPTARDIAAAVNAPVEDVLEAMEAATAYEAVSLDAPRPGTNEDEAWTLGESLCEEEQGYELVEIGETLRGTLEALPARERLILRLRFEEDLTQAEIAETIGVSQMHVSRLLRRSLDRLSAAGAAAA